MICLQKTKVRKNQLIWKIVRLSWLRPAVSFSWWSQVLAKFYRIKRRRTFVWFMVQFSIIKLSFGWKSPANRIAYLSCYINIKRSHWKYSIRSSKQHIQHPATFTSITNTFSLLVFKVVPNFLCSRNKTFFFVERKYLIQKTNEKMEVDEEEFEPPTSSSSKGDKKRFEVKKVCEPHILVESF